jgi:hypothetical protein
MMSRSSTYKRAASFLFFLVRGSVRILAPSAPYTYWALMIDHTRRTGTMSEALQIILFMLLYTYVLLLTFCIMLCSLYALLVAVLATGSSI